MALSDHGFSLYLHVPFCTDKCLYCDFYSVPRHTVSPAVLTRVVEQVAGQAHRLCAAGGLSPRTVFIGGGTPSCLPPASLRRLLRAVPARDVEEWTVETNPETLDEPFLHECAEAGVTRLSIGIQSRNARMLQTLRRRATPDHVRAAVDLVRRRWTGDLNLDFITGIPGQTVADVLDDLALVEPGWPQHVSLYQLTVEPGTPLEGLVVNRSLALNPPEVDEELWIAGRDALEAKGYRQYEVSNFAVPGKECRHNLRYWRIEPYAGAGPGAVSTLPGAWAAAVTGRAELASAGSVVRFSVPRDIAAFLRGPEHFWGTETEVVAAADFLLETLMMGLRLADGIPRSSLTHRFGSSFEQLFPGLWDEWVEAGLAVASSPSLRLSRPGLLILDHLLGQIADRLPRGQLNSASVHWPA